MNYKPPQAVQSEARRALKWIEEGHAGQGFTDTGRKRASDLARGAAVSRETIGRIANYLARHEGDKKGPGWNAGDKEFPSPGRVAWAAWGGDPAKPWTAGIINSEEKSLFAREGCECWDGYCRVPGTDPCSPGSCEKCDANRVENQAEISGTRNGAKMTALMNRERILDVREERTGATPLEFREDKATGYVILRGYAATYEPYDCYGGPEAGGWVEQLRADAFDKTLRAEPDVMLLLNHTGAPLARTKSGTMTLSRDRRGLLVEARLDPSDPDVQSLLPKMRRGDLDEMSFAFRVKEQEWDTNYTHRMIHEVSLQKGDVSVVNYGMNPNTRVAVAEGTVGALAELSHAQLAELRNLDSGLISRAISNLKKVKESRAVDKKPMDEKKGGNPFAEDEEGTEEKGENPFASDDDENDDEEAKYGDEKDKEACATCDTCGAEKKSDNPFADEESEDDEVDDEDEDPDKAQAARALKNTLDQAMKAAGDGTVRRLIARAQGQLKVARGQSKTPTVVDALLAELRSTEGDPGGTVTEGLEYLRQYGPAPMGIEHRRIKEAAEARKRADEASDEAVRLEALAADRAIKRAGL